MSALTYPQQLFGDDNEFENIMAIEVVDVQPSEIKEIVDSTNINPNDFTDGESVTPPKQTNLTSQFRRTSNIIYVPAPQNINYNESHSWEQGDLGLFRNFKEENIFSKFSSLEGLTDVGKDILSGLSSASSLRSDRFSNAQSFRRQAIKNPHMEILYRSPNFRTFQFTYKFTPLEAADCESITNIIKTLRYAGATSTTVVDFLAGRDGDSDDFFGTDNWFTFPSEFKLKFLLKGADGTVKENPYFTKIKNCVLTDFSMNYSSVGTYSTYENGFPAEIEISMSLTETEIIMKNSILDGF